MQHRPQVQDIMTHKVVVLSEEDNLSRVAAGLDHYRFHHLPVVDDGKLVGMISQRDLLRTTVAGVDRSALARSREARFLEALFVRDVMHIDPLTASPTEPVSSAAKRMLEARIGALPVVDEERRLVGILTENDVLRMVASQGALDEQPWSVSWDAANTRAG